MKLVPKFDQEWFKAQFGNRPKRLLSEISQDITNARDILEYLERELFEAEIYLAKEDAALKTFVKTVFDLKGGK